MLTRQQKTPKIKIEFTDMSGAKYSLSVEGGMSKESITKMVDFANQMSSPQEQIPQKTADDYPNIDTNFSRLYGLLETKFKFGMFTSSDVMEAYEQQFDAQTTLSTISTYLSRLFQRGLVTRSRNGSGWTYRLIRSTVHEESLPSQQSNDALTSPNLFTP